MTDQEMQAVFEKLQKGIELTNDEMIALARESGYMAGQFKRLGVGVDDLRKSVKKAQDELPTALLKSAAGATRSLGGLAKSLGEAETGFRTLTPIIDAAAAAFSTVPILGGMVKATAEASKFMINQLQNATDAFQEVAKVGGLTATGMTGLQQQFLASGMQLKSYTKTIGANSAALANFAGSVGAGAEKFSQTAGTVQKQFGLGLQRLGYGIDEIGETTASYIARQTRLGLAQGKSNEVLAAGAAKYALELDELSKLTGASKEELKKQQDAALSESRFRGKIEEMRMNGQEAEAEKLIAAQAALSKQSPALGKAFRDSVSGFIGTSKESVAGFQSMGGDMSELVNKALTGSISDVTNFSQQSMKKMLPMYAQFAQMGIDVGIPFSEMADAANGVTKSSKDVQDAQKQQLTAPDKLTDQTVEAQRNMQQLSIQIQQLGFTFMPAAATAVNSFPGALNTLPGVITKEIGGPNVKINGGATKVAAANMTTEQKNAAKKQALIDQRLAEAQEAAINPTAGTGNLGQGPVFGSSEGVQRTLTEIRDEIKKLVQLGGIAGSPASMSAAMTAHDASHKHEPPTITPEAAKELGQGLGSPLKNLAVTSGFGMRTDPFTGKQAGHGGVDLAGKIGDAIMAPESGIARVVGEAQSGGYGNMVEILNEQGKVIHRLAHMSETMIKTGDKITAGAQIGKVGSTGRSTGAHLHWEQFDPTSGKQVDPIAMLAARQGRGAAPSGALGSLAQKYESGAAGSMAVGYDRVGGTSYGKYQIASKVGAMDDFLKMLDKTNPEAAARLRGAGPADAGQGGKFAQEWKALAKSGALGDAESQFAMEKIYKPALGGLKDQGLRKMIEGNKGLQEMFHSTAVQHGAAGGSGILNKVYKQGMSSEDLVKAVYAERGTRFGGSTEQVRASVQGRFGREQQDVLSMLGVPGTSTMLATPTAPTAAPAYTTATAGLAGQGQNVISTGLSAITTALFGGGAQGAPGTAAAGAGGGSEVVTLLSQLVALSRDQNSNLSKILSASTA